MVQVHYAALHAALRAMSAGQSESAAAVSGGYERPELHVPALVVQMESTIVL